MAVESLECCLSRAIGSSCTEETQTYSSVKPGRPRRTVGGTAWGRLVSHSVASTNQCPQPRCPESQDATQEPAL